MQLTPRFGRRWLGVVAASILSLSALAGPAEDLAIAREAINTGDVKQAVPLLVVLANGGVPEAQRLLGELAYQGKGVPKDFAAALAWNDLAARAGDRIAQYNLGLMHEHGAGVSPSKETALYWYEMSGAQQYGPAQVRAGDLAMERDRSKAAYWYNQAALNGDADAIRKARAAAGAIADENTANEARNARDAAIAAREAAETRAWRAAKDEETRQWMRKNPGQPAGANLPPVPNFSIVAPSTSRVVPAQHPTTSSSFSGDPDASTSSGPGQSEGRSGSSDASGSARSSASVGGRSSSNSTDGAGKSSGDSRASNTSGHGRQAETGAGSGAARSAAKSETSPSLTLTRIEGPDPAVARREQEERDRRLAKEAKDAADRKAANDAYWKQQEAVREKQQKEDLAKGQRLVDCWNRGGCDNGPSTPSKGVSR